MCIERQDVSSERHRDATRTLGRRRCLPIFLWRRNKHNKLGDMRRRNTYSDKKKLFALERTCWQTMSSWNVDRNNSCSRLQENVENIPVVKPFETTSAVTIIAIVKFQVFNTDTC